MVSIVISTHICLFVRSILLQSFFSSLNSPAVSLFIERLTAESNVLLTTVISLFFNPVNMTVFPSTLASAASVCVDTDKQVIEKRDIVSVVMS